MPALTLILMLILLALSARVAAGIQQSRNARAELAARRLGIYARHGRPYLMFVGFNQPDNGMSAAGFAVPRSADRGQRWLPIAEADDEGVTLEDGRRLPLAGVQSFAVAYPSGRIIDAHAAFEPLPPGVHFPEPMVDAEEDRLGLDDLAAGNAFLRVSFQPAPFPGGPSDRWQVHLANTGDAAIRVVSFGVYDCAGDECVLATETGAAYSEEEFLEWFDREGAPWLAPGEHAVDLNGYGAEGQVWAFYFETASGEDLAAGAVIPPRDMT